MNTVIRVRHVFGQSAKRQEGEKNNKQTPSRNFGGFRTRLLEGLTTRRDICTVSICRGYMYMLTRTSGL